MGISERRIFRRYDSGAECLIRRGSETCLGSVDNYSATGMCITTKHEARINPGTQVTIDIPDLKMTIACEVIWVRESGSRHKLGFMRVGNIAGELEHFFLADVLTGLQRSTRTGILEVKSHSVTRKIFIKNGDIIYSSSDSEDEQLGEFLFTKGKITWEQFQLATGMMLKTQQKLGKTLVEMGHFAPKDLFQAVRTQKEEIILNLFRVFSGSFEFREQISEPNILTFPMKAANIIYRGIKRISSFTALSKICPPLDAVLNFSSDPLDLFQSIVLTPSDKEILSLINGAVTVRSILTRSPLKDFETLKTLCAFIKIGLITVREEYEEPVIFSQPEMLGEPESELPPEFVREVEDMHEKCSHLGCYDILNISKQASPEEIRNAYFCITKKFHPDQHFSLLSHDIKGKLINIVSHVLVAYETLSDPGKRLHYDGLKTVPVPPVTQDEDIAEPVVTEVINEAAESGDKHANGNEAKPRRKKRTRRQRKKPDSESPQLIW